jgi:hypothetical protein
MSRYGHLYKDPPVGSFGDVVDLEVKVLPRMSSDIPMASSSGVRLTVPTVWSSQV